MHKKLIENIIILTINVCLELMLVNLDQEQMCGMNISLENSVNNLQKYFCILGISDNI